jgi:hypothetical protein
MWHAWEKEQTCTEYWWESPKERYHLEDQGVDGRMGSKRTLGRLLGGGGGFTWLRIGTVGGSCEYGDEPSVSGATELVC